MKKEAASRTRLPTRRGRSEQVQLSEACARLYSETGERETLRNPILLTANTLPFTAENRVKDTFMKKLLISNIKLCLTTVYELNSIG